MSNRAFSYSLLILCVFYLKYTQSVAPGALGPADIDVKSVELCENSEQYANQVIIGRKKLNRTHEALDIDVMLKDVIGPDVFVYINFAKWGDGGFKPNFYVIDEPDACSFVFKWINKTLADILASQNEPPVCPLKAKNYSVKKYLIDYTKLPQEMIYGKFRGDVFLRKDGKDILCFRLFADSKPKTGPPAPPAAPPGAPGLG